MPSILVHGIAIRKRADQLTGFSVRFVTVLRIRTGNAALSMSVLNNATIDTLRPLGVSNLATARRKNALKFPDLFRNLVV